MSLRSYVALALLFGGAHGVARSRKLSTGDT